MPRESRLYDVLARYYDQIYHWKDYQKEAEQLSTLIHSYKRSSGNSLLDVACGTGKHMQYLQDEFDCVGVDISRQMLAVARRNVPAAEFVRGNMVDFDLGRRFDVVLCLFSSIGYLRTRKEVGRAMVNFSRHLKEGGVMIIEPWLRKSAWRDKTVHMRTYESDSLRIARVSFGRAKGSFSILDEGYLIAEKGKGIIYVRDRHEMRFFEPNWTLAAMGRTGLDCRFTEEGLNQGRGLLIANK